MNNPKLSLTPLNFFLSFLTSLDFLMSHEQHLAPRYLVDTPLPAAPESYPPRFQIAILMRRVLLNLPQYSTGERADIYRWSTEDTGRLWELPMPDSKERAQRITRRLEVLLGMTVNHTPDAEISEYVKLFIDEIDGKVLLQ